MVLLIVRHYEYWYPHQSFQQNGYLIQTWPRHCCLICLFSQVLCGFFQICIKRYICAWIGKFAKFHSNSFRFESCFPWKLIQTAFDLETTTIWKSLPFERQSLFLLWFTTKGTFSKTNAKSLQSLSDLINLGTTCWRRRRRRIKSYWKCWSSLWMGPNVRTDRTTLAQRVQM